MDQGIHQRIIERCLANVREIDDAFSSDAIGLSECAPKIFYRVFWNSWPRRHICPLVLAGSSVANAHC
jgi:hypothetical protein